MIVRNEVGSFAIAPATKSISATSLRTAACTIGIVFMVHLHDEIGCRAVANVPKETVFIAGGVQSNLTSGGSVVTLFAKASLPTFVGDHIHA
jgi:hypothetical protein